MAESPMPEIACPHSADERRQLAEHPQFCPLCLHDEIKRLIAMNRDLIAMLKQADKDDGSSTRT